MKITKERRKTITDAQKVTDLISNKLKKEKEGKGKDKSINLDNIAKKLTERRDRVLGEEENEI